MERKIKGLLKQRLPRKILAFFHKNQGSIDTVSGISAWVRERKSDTEAALEKLVDLGLINETSAGATKGYCYTRNSEIIKIVSELLKSDA